MMSDFSIRWRITKNILRVKNILNIELPMDLQIFAFLSVHSKYLHIMGTTVHFFFRQKKKCE